MNYNQSIVKNLLKSTLESERLKLLSERKCFTPVCPSEHTLRLHYLDLCRSVLNVNVF